MLHINDVDNHDTHPIRDCFPVEGDTVKDNDGDHVVLAAHLRHINANAIATDRRSDTE